MSAGFDLKEFLDSQVCEGVVDSEGVFTVAREKALTKLANFGLPGDYAWVLKIVQAVNLWRVPRLQVRQSRVATSFFFCPARGGKFPSESAIVQALNSPVLAQDEPVHQLAMALRSLVQQARLSFVLAVREHGELGKPIFAGDDTSSLDSLTRERWTHLDREGVRLTVSHFRGNESITGRYIPTFSRVVKRHALIASELERRCFASAVPIELDGRIVSTVFPTGRYEQDRYYRPVVVGRLHAEAEQTFSVERFDVLSGRIRCQRLAICAASENQQQPWFLLRGPELHAIGELYKIVDAMLAGPPELRDRVHTFCWVRQGVVVDKRVLHVAEKSDLLLSVFFPADHLRTDLSGLQIQLGRGTPAEAVAAMGSLRAHLESLPQGEIARRLQDDPLLAEAGAAGGSGPSQELNAVGQSTLTDSIAVQLPSLTSQAMRALDGTSELLTRTVLAGSRLESWASHVQGALQRLLIDLRRVDAVSEQKLD
jgi:hypothetical protein